MDHVITVRDVLITSGVGLVILVIVSAGLSYLLALDRAL